MPVQLLYGLAAALGALLGMANPYLHFPPAILALPAGLLALAMDAPTGRLAFKRCWLAASLGCLGCLAWVYWPVHHFGGVHWLLALPVPVLLSMAMAVYFGLFGLLAHHAMRRLGPLVALPLLAAAWGGMELAMGTLLSGFPWVVLSGAFGPWPMMLQAAAYVGSLGLSVLLALVGLGIAASRRTMLAPVLSAFVLSALVAVGWGRMQAFQDSGPQHTVAIAQGNIDQSVKWDPTYQQGTVDTYVALSRQALERKPELVVWPETAMPFYFQDETPLREPVLRFVEDTGVPVLVGAPGYRMQASLNPGGGYELFNRAFLVVRDQSARVGIAGLYDKEHLVPFGEYMPLPSWLPMDKLVNGVGDFIPGRDQKPIQSGEMDLGVLVCYEAIFPELAQERVRQGANLLVNISNDAWFGATSAPLQHLYLTALRAVEQGRWIVRSTNTGISAYIDPLGRIQVAGPQFEALSAAAVVRSRAETTLYHALHTPLRIALAALTALLVGLIILRGKHARPGASR